MDRLGRQANKVDDQEGYGRDKTSPYAMEATKRQFSKYTKVLEEIPSKKKMIFESERKANSLLDENQIRE
jgi:hypothetical protein